MFDSLTGGWGYPELLRSAAFFGGGGGRVCAYMRVREIPSGTAKNYRRSRERPPVAPRTTRGAPKRYLTIPRTCAEVKPGNTKKADGVSPRRLALNLAEEI